MASLYRGRSASSSGSVAGDADSVSGGSVGWFHGSVASGASARSHRTVSVTGAAAKTEEHARLRASDARHVDWREWGPYVAERAWGTGACFA